MTTPLGQVLDLSASGMKLFIKGRLTLAAGDRFDASLDERGGQVDLTGRVVRIEKLGVRRHAVAVQFIDMTLEQRRRLESIVDAAMFVSPRLWIAA